MPDTLPAIFFGHGNPMNAVAHNDYTEAWRRIGEETPKPKAILSISAHWYVREPASRSRRRPAPSMISAVFRRNSFRCTIPRPAIPLSRAAFSSFWRRWM